MQQTQDESASQKELLEEANNLLNMFNEEKHEVKAKFKYLMQLIELPAMTDSQLDVEPLSSYKGRDDEVELLTCFEELEALVIEFKQNKEGRISELTSDNQQQASRIVGLQDQQSLLQQQLCELNKVLKSLEGN